MGICRLLGSIISILNSHGVDSRARYDFLPYLGVYLHISYLSPWCHAHLLKLFQYEYTIIT